MPKSLTGLAAFAVLIHLLTHPVRAGEKYDPRGIGGGGAMASYSISPYSKLRFVGTDMGTLFRSTNQGKTWEAVDHREAVFSSDLANASYVGFSSDGHTVFHAAAGRNPKRSLDAGIKWTDISVPLGKEERIRYWVSDRQKPGDIFCATSEGLLQTRDKGLTWKRVPNVTGQSTGTFLYYPDSKKRVIYHASRESIWLSKDTDKDFKPWYTPSSEIGIRSFSGGADENGVTLAFIDTQGKKACAWAKGDADTEADCGYVWIARQDAAEQPQFRISRQEAGRFVRLAENDSRTIYITGGKWIRQYGSKVWISTDRGETWRRKFHIYDWDHSPFRPWPKDKLEYSAAGLDIGWDDNAYFSFSVNPRNSAEAGGTGHYFLHTTLNQGETWQAPFTAFADSGDRSKGKRWRSTGLEVTSVLRLKFHPGNPKLGYASMADIAGLVTEDGGESWRVTKAQYNTNYDYAFDPTQPDWVYAASGSLHDFPMNLTSVVKGNGGIYLSKDRGKTWRRLTPQNALWDRQFLSVAYDPVHKILYGGTQGGGIGRSLDGGRTWEFMSEGLPKGPQIFPQIEIDPKNGDAYALLAGDAPEFKNQSFTGIYHLKASASKPRWELLRGTVEYPQGLDRKYALWYFPTSFAVDFSKPNRNELWLADFESNGAWLASGIWKSTDRGKTWSRSTQYTHPTSITLDPNQPGRVYASGHYAIKGDWGKGGALYSLNGGATWEKNEALPFGSNLDGTVPDPSDPKSVFYLFFGAGMLHGKAPQ